MSQLVISEIIRRSLSSERVAVIEKWITIADICRCLHNFNGVLQICSALSNSAVFRLKKTWEKISKPVCQPRKQISISNPREASRRSGWMFLYFPVYLSVYLSLPAPWPHEKRYSPEI